MSGAALIDAPVPATAASSSLGWKRWLLWITLALLVTGLLGTLVWLAGRYEETLQQDQLDRDTVALASDIRSGLNRNLQSLQSLQASGPSPQGWAIEAAALLREHREMLRIEWRGANFAISAAADTPYRPDPFGRVGRDSTLGELVLACNAATRFNGAAYSSSYFLPQRDGTGIEIMDVCLPVVRDGQPTGHVVASYVLAELLAEFAPRQATRDQQLAFTEADGTRLALYGDNRRRGKARVSQQIMDLPGQPLVLRVERWTPAPGLFPNVLTALVGTMTLALVLVLALLVRDSRRRLRAERSLAEALAFRKAMEDSLVTGLRARDLQGRVTYVNPAFCDMVGFSADELMINADPPPYWPPEMVETYRDRLASRLAGTVPPREGFESVFMRRDGTRFPVLVIEAPLINAVGVQTGWMSAFLDISEQRRIEEISRATQERLQATARLATVGEMASLLSHELNQPLAAISSYATGSLNLLQHGSPPLTDLQQALLRIAAQAERAGKVIRSVHDFVRRRDQQREAVAPQALIDAVMPLMVLQARKLSVQMLVDIAVDVPPVWCDRTMVEQVLINLARNGMQAMDDPAIAPRELRIGVRLLPSRGWVEFSVEDGGSGIGPDVASRLFTPFFTTKPQGMGLGLSLCRTVVEQHGGALDLSPRQPRGTVFRFTLAVAPSDPQTHPGGVMPGEPQTTSSPSQHAALS